MNFCMRGGPVRSLGQVRSFGSSGFTMSPSFKSRTELNGPVMTSSPALRPFSTSKYLSPAMPVLTGMNVGLGFLDQEDALGVLPRLAGGQRIGRAHLRGRLLRVGLGLRDDLAGRVVDQLAHGHRLDRHGHRLGPRRRRDVGGAGEAGTHLGDLAVDRHRDLEVGRGLAGLPGGGLDDRAVADLGHLAGEGLVRDRVDLDLGQLADLDERDVGLVDLDFGLDDRHVGDLQQHGAGVVHRADDDRLALLDVAPDDQAVDRRLDAGPRQLVLRRSRRRRPARGCAAPACRATARRRAGSPRAP